MDYIPVVPQFVFHFRPAEIWSGKEAELELVATLGNLGEVYGALGDSAKSRDVLERACIRVNEAATLIGVMDEEGVLEYGEARTRDSNLRPLHCCCCCC